MISNNDTLPLLTLFFSRACLCLQTDARRGLQINGIFYEQPTKQCNKILVLYNWFISFIAWGFWEWSPLHCLYGCQGTARGSYSSQRGK